MYEIVGITDEGKVRPHNEDRFLLAGEVIAEGERMERTDLPFLAAVADGMGGENAGEVASSLTLQYLAGRAVTLEKEEIKAAIERGIQGQLRLHVEENQERKGMGTTLAGIVCQDDRLQVFHVGDSRVYRFRDGFLKPLTKDHSLVERLYDTGQITYEEKQNHSQRHVLLRSLGEKETIAEVTSFPYKVDRGDTFILCSDGLSDVVSNLEIEQMVQGREETTEVARSLVALANERGGPDNITVLVVKRIQ
ncbi:PP2C family serine/threonine-protein phosphatase [Thalassobacillus sp. C254]|uniref:PP2C family protein-serine/threonine phosphatase n=1 Tax=Thalassobacillus sp. C254 TaxID=1225341 RepID=UPI0006D03F97|nr:protein phosphatase 2C domain-containing protein [Thalassobacillus sp. C254]